jgi:hypothetical protein
VTSSVVLKILPMLSCNTCALHVVRLRLRLILCVCITIFPAKNTNTEQ